MDLAQIELLLDAAIGHFVLAAVGFIIMMMLKDAAMDYIKARKFKKAYGLAMGDQVLIGGEQAVVSAIGFSSYTFILWNGTARMRTVSLDRLGYLDIQRVVIGHEDLHKHTGE